MADNQPEIYIPLEYSNIKEVIPSQDKILYSTLCRTNFRGQLSIQGTHYTQRITEFTSHVILTSSGIAFTMPNEDKVNSHYLPWHEVSFIFNTKDLYGFKLRNLNFFPAMNSDIETYEKFMVRSAQFIDKIRPIIIREKQKWLEENINNPAIDKIDKTGAKNFIEILKKDEEKKQKEEEKKRKVEEKKRLKEEKNKK